MIIEYDQPKKVKKKKYLYENKAVLHFFAMYVIRTKFIYVFEMKLFRKNLQFLYNFSNMAALPLVSYLKHIPENGIFLTFYAVFTCILA